MSKNQDGKPISRQELQRLLAPIEIESRTHGTIRLQPFGSQEHYRAVAAAHEHHADDVIAASANVAQSLLDGVPRAKAPDVEFGRWDTLELADLLNSYMSVQRSRFSAPRSPDIVFDEFMAQCGTKLEKHLELGRQAAQSIARMMRPLVMTPQDSLKNFDQWFGSPVWTDASKRAAESSQRMSKMVESLSGVHADSTRRIAEALVSVTSPESSALRDIATTRERMAAALTKLQPSFDEFYWRSTELWTRIHKALQQFQERLERDAQLRKVGIDVERLRLVGPITWLAAVYAALEEPGDSEDRTSVLVEQTATVEFQAEILRQTQELPVEVRELRRSAIKEGLDAHNAGNYISSCSVLIAQLDGLLGDILVDFEGPELGGDRRKNMRRRVTDLEQLIDPDNKYPSALAAQFGVVDPPVGMEAEREVKFDTVRNALAHGDPSAQYTELQSAKLIFMIASQATLYIALKDQPNHADTEFKA